MQSTKKMINEWNQKRPFAKK